MNILVCIKRVPDFSEGEIAINPKGNDIERDELVYTINEPDNYAVEEAIQIVSRIGGEVTVVTIGDDEHEEVLRREMAMGAKHAVLLSDPAFAEGDARLSAEVLKSFIATRSFDLVLTGVQADGGGAQIGGMLAALLNYPFASLVTSIEVLTDKKLRISREIEGGNREISEVELPCVLSIQTGINEPRYVGMRGIRQVASIPIPTLTSEDLALSRERLRAIGSRVRRIDYFLPPAGKGARLLTGKPERIADEIYELLESKGVAR